MKPEDSVRKTESAMQPPEPDCVRGECPECLAIRIRGPVAGAFLACEE
jgi:hypothetical protein